MTARSETITAALTVSALVGIGVAGGIALSTSAWGQGTATVTVTATPSVVTVTARPTPAPTRTVYVTRASRSQARVSVPVRPAAARATGSVSIYQAYARDRVSAAQWPCLRTLVQRESSWRPTAVNGSHYGLFQMRGLAHSTGWKRQIDRGLGYIDHRYGTPCAALAHSDRNGWY